MAAVNEERQLVLQMLAEGKITVAEAEALLDALAEPAAVGSSAEPASSAAAPTPRGYGPAQLVRRVLREVDEALDRALRVMERRLAEQEQREPYRQIRALAGWLERKSAVQTETLRRVDGCLRTNG